LTNAPCRETVLFIRICDRIDIELSTYDAHAIKTWSRPWFRFRDAQPPVTGPLHELLESDPFASLVSISQDHIYLSEFIRAQSHPHLRVYFQTRRKGEGEPVIHGELSVVLDHYEQPLDNAPPFDRRTISQGPPAPSPNPQ
jgi:hypothetical protein